MHGMKWGSIVVMVLLVSLTVVNAQEVKPFQLALVPDVQIVRPADSVSGFRLSIYGENQDVTGVDLGIVNLTKGNFKGFGLDVISMIDGDAEGLMWNWLGYGRVSGDVTGWHHAFVFSYLQGETKGVQTSLVARNRSDFTGVQLGAYTETGAHIGGVQAGIVNRASSVKGLQLGLLNMTDDMYGIQIGLVNYIKTGYLPFFVIANGKF